MPEPPPPPRDPGVPPEDETVVADDWAVRPEGQVVVERAETEVERVPRRRMPVVWPWLLALLLLVLAGLGAYYYFTQKDEKTVPAVIGLNQERAEVAVRDAGLDPATTRRESSKPDGIVLAQSPDPGAKADDGDEVQLVVSNGPARETVPDVVGETFDAAGEELKAIGLMAKRVDTFDDTGEGKVLRQDPPAGAKAPEDAIVALTVSKGRQPVTVPDVVGTTSSEATATLRDAGLRANVVGVPSDQPPGTVVAQSPTAGKQLKSGATVRLNVALGADETTTQPGTTTAPPNTTAPPQPATVPDVVGKELADAARAFADEGLKVAVKYVPSGEPQGRVVAQAQPAGTTRKRGDTVQLNVSIGAQPAAEAAVPDVVGQRQDQARRALESAGFEVLALNLNGDVRNESPVASQTPAGGANVPRGSLVLLYVGA